MTLYNVRNLAHPRHLAREARKAVESWMPRAVILLYHRVAEVALDPQLLCVRPAHFAEHLTVLSERYYPLSLVDLSNRARDGRLPKHAVAITFDDGYADNALNARPGLAAREIPATVFVTTGYVGGEREFWWDELERSLLIPESTPPVLQVRTQERTRCWPTSSMTERRGAYDALQSWIRPMPAEQIDAVLNQLRSWANHDGRARPSHRVMTQQEVEAIGRDGLIELGAHTRNHVSLAAQPVITQQDEIAGSKHDLEGWLNRPVTSFSYPFGAPRIDYNRDTAALVRAVGFHRTAANYEGRLTRMSDAHQLPRCLVRDWDGDEFARNLRRFFHD